MGEKQDGAGAEKKNDGEKKAAGGEGNKKEGGGGMVPVVLKVDLHCEGCAQKVKRSVKHIPGVDSVKADFQNNKLTVMGKVDPVKIKEKVAEKTKKKVDLISPQPKKENKEGGGDKKPEGEKSAAAGAGGDKKPEKKDEEKKPKQPPVTSAVMKTRVHCDGCANKIKRILRKYDGVEDVNVDLAKDQIAVKGTMDMKELLPYMNVKLKRPVELVAPSAPKKDNNGGGGDEKKSKDGGESGDKKKGGGGGGGDGDKKKGGGGGDKKKEGGGGGKDADGGGAKSKSVSVEETAVSTVDQVNKMEYFASPYAFGGGYGAPGPQMYAYPPMANHFDAQASSSGGSNGYMTEHWHAPQPQLHPQQYYMHGGVPQPPPMMMPQPDYYMHQAPPPQMFSDENPNACSLM